MASAKHLRVKHIFIAGIIFAAIAVVIVLMSMISSITDVKNSSRSASLNSQENMDVIYSERRRDISHVCHLYPNLKRPFTPETVSKMIVDPIHRIMFCPAGKAASTFWKQILEISSGIFNNSNPLEVYDEDYQQLYYLQKLNPVPQKIAMNCFKSFFFTRHPLSRIYSAYNDKLYMSNFYYWGAWGTKIIKKFRPGASAKSIECGHDVTFAEFIKFLIFVYETNNPASADTHISPISSQCKPCSINYTYIGKLETLVKDVQTLLPVLGLEKKIVFTDLKDQYERQGLADLVHRNLNWHTTHQQIKNCISQSDLILRLYNYSRNVGHIDFNSRPSVNLKGRSDVSIKEMTDILMAARPLPNMKQHVKQYKKIAMQKAYATVSSGDMEKLINIYRLDFEMFGYDPVP